ncbi:hypothetical protein BDW72DRAFT_69402 [Aspergillus terricola var. indicus]
MGYRGTGSLWKCLGFDSSLRRVHERRTSLCASSSTLAALAPMGTWYTGRSMAVLCLEDFARQSIRESTINTAEAVYPITRGLRGALTKSASSILCLHKITRARELTVQSLLTGVSGIYCRLPGLVLLDGGGPMHGRYITYKDRGCRPGTFSLRPYGTRQAY